MSVGNSDFIVLCDSTYSARLSSTGYSFLEFFFQSDDWINWLTILYFSGKDLIGVQNLLKKHQALQAEIAGHEPRIKAVTQKGNAMVEEGMSLFLFFVFQEIQESSCRLEHSLALYN